MQKIADLDTVINYINNTTDMIKVFSGSYTGKIPANFITQSYSESVSATNGNYIIIIRVDDYSFNIDSLEVGVFKKNIWYTVYTTGGGSVQIKEKLMYNGKAIGYNVTVTGTNTGYSTPGIFFSSQRQYAYITF